MILVGDEEIGEDEDNKEKNGVTRVFLNKQIQI